MAIDEMQHAVMRAAEAEILQDGVGVAGEIAIGEEQQLGEFEQLRLGQGRLRDVASIAARAWRFRLTAKRFFRGFQGLS